MGDIHTMLPSIDVFNDSAGTEFVPLLDLFVEKDKESESCFPSYPMLTFHQEKQFESNITEGLGWLDGNIAVWYLI